MGFLQIDSDSMQKKMTPEEYLRFCDFCLKNNPHITAENCLARKTREEEIKVPFHLS